MGSEIEKPEVSKYSTIKYHKMNLLFFLCTSILGNIFLQIALQKNKLYIPRICAHYTFAVLGARHFAHSRTGPLYNLARSRVSSLYIIVRARSRLPYILAKSIAKSLSALVRSRATVYCIIEPVKRSQKFTMPC